MSQTICLQPPFNMSFTAINDPHKTQHERALKQVAGMSPVPGHFCSVQAMFSFPECICVTWAYYANTSLYDRLQIVLFCGKLYYHFPVILSLSSCSFFFHFYLRFMACLLYPLFLSLMHFFSQTQIPRVKRKTIALLGE